RTTMSASRRSKATMPGRCGARTPAVSGAVRCSSAARISTEGRPMKMFPRPRRFTMTLPTRSILFAGVLAAMSHALWAQTSVNDYGVHHRGSVIGDDVLYSIGGGRAVSMGPVGQMQHLGVGIGWNSNLI